MALKKILIIRFSSIGDIVLTTPIIRCLKLQLGVELHILTKHIFSTVVSQNPYIDKIHYAKEHIKDTIAILKKENYDVIIDLQKNLHSYRIKTKLTAVQLTFEKLNIKKWLLVNLKVNSLPDMHIVDRYFDAIKSLGVVNDGQGLNYFILPENEEDALHIINGISYQVLVLGANYFTKRIPLAKCREIIHNNHGHTVLLGGADVTELAYMLANEFPEKTINLCGKIGLPVSAGVIKHAKRIVTSDTGLMHIAAAFQKEIFVLWGNTVSTFGMYPYYGADNINKVTHLEVLGLDCRPCSKLGFDKCPKGHFKCMMDIDVSALGEATIITNS